MKKLLLVCLFVFISGAGFSQMLLHDDTDISIPITPSFFRNTPPDPAVYQKKVFNIYFHILTEEGANSDIGEVAVMDAVKNLNVAYNQFYVYFKYRGFKNIYSNEYIDIRTPGNTVSPSLPTQYDLNNFSLQNNYQSDEAINIYVVRNFFQIVNGIETTLPGFAISLFNANVSNNMPNIFITAEYLRSGVLAHEMGHIFGAEHTNKSGVGLTPPTTAVCEYVNRAEDGPDPYNAFYAGDGNVDTNASPSEYEDADVDANGVYIGDQRDCSGVIDGTEGELYRTHLVPIKNFMNVNRVEDIRFMGEFTYDQGVRFRNIIDNPFVNSPMPFYETTVESLYEPFEIRSTVELGAVLSVEDQPSEGGAIVCRQQQYDLRFQKGFDYSFTNTTPDNLTADIDTQFNYSILPHHTITVLVRQVDLTATRDVRSPINKVDRICFFESYVSGVILSSQILGSMNITVEYLDAVRVKDPDLYNSLMEQYYYILKKQTVSGAIKETVFYKP